jgi:hypothetical protein
VTRHEICLECLRAWKRISSKRGGCDTTGFVPEEVDTKSCMFATSIWQPDGTVRSVVNQPFQPNRVNHVLEKIRCPYALELTVLEENT